MNDHALYSFFAAILPVLLGLGLIELYVTRDLSFGVICAGIVALAIVMTVIAALADVAKASGSRRRSRT
ncbi:MAG TPA: hypothetical protein VM051_00100 [Usitatibacter sp.]|nr:hypothetical protein [Usitatibacter sp.]